MFKYLLIINLLIMTVFSQDMPPPDLDISSRQPLITTEPTTLQPTTPEPTTTEVITTSTEAETTTTTTESFTTKAPDTTTEPIASTSITSTTTTIRNDVPTSPVTDSPFLTTTTTTTLAPKYPFYPSQPDYFGMRCYFKQQYGYPKWIWTCQGFKYMYPIECFKCCYIQQSSFAGCVTVHAHHCNSINHRHGYYK